MQRWLLNMSKKTPQNSPKKSSSEGRASPKRVSLKEFLSIKVEPKILVLDIETSPIVSYTWGLFDQNIGLEQIVQESNILSVAVKWLGDNRVFCESTGRR